MRDISILTNNGVDINKSLELFGDMETYNDTIGEFLIGANEKLPKLKEYKEKGDMANYAIYVHSLKSDAKYFGFMKLADIAYDQEMKSKSNDLYYIAAHFDELMEEANKTIHIVKQYIGEEPVAPITASSKIISEKVPEVLTTTQVVKNKTILVVDDSNIIRTFIQKVFKEYDVLVASDGEEALNIIKSNVDNGNILAMLLDLNMPNVDGFDVLDYFKENNLFKVIPVSIISGDNSKETIDKAFTYNIVDMLPKPFNELDVKHIVEKTINYKKF